MKFVSKIPANTKNYWVEDYTPEEKAFFIGLGFTESDYSHIPKGFAINSTLQFEGSGPFGFWTKEEETKIATAIVVKFSINIEIEQFDGHQ